MTASDLLQAGNLSATIAQVTEQVKARPGDPQPRTFLFELLCFAGELDRAARQLDVLGSQCAEAEAAVQRYRNLLQGERLRRRLFSEGLRPGLPQRLPGYTELHLEAVNRLRENKAAEARALLEEAEAARPRRSGRLNGEAFDDFKDADDLIGPFLEVITHVNYCWIPFEAIKTVSIPAPTHLRDLLWVPAKIELEIEPLGEAFLPALYIHSHVEADEQVRLGRVTEWRADVEGLAIGLGQRVFWAGEQERAILDVRELEFDHADGAGN